MRMVGPNCMGLLNTRSAVRLNASFSPIFPPAGHIGLLSQSGALGIAILELATERRLGLSTFVSAGNKADVSGNDLLEYWEQDPSTHVLLLYLESFGNPRRFARLARRIGRTKPIVVVKSGRTDAGARAAGSHTAALAASDVTVDALFPQSGVIRADTLDEMFDLAACLELQPLPGGPPRRRSSPTRAAPASWRPMPARPRASRWPISRRRRARRLTAQLPDDGERRQSRRHDRVGGSGALPPDDRDDADRAGSRLAHRDLHAGRCGLVRTDSAGDS